MKIFEINQFQSHFIKLCQYYSKAVLIKWWIKLYCTLSKRSKRTKLVLLLILIKGELFLYFKKKIIFRQINKKEIVWFYNNKSVTLVFLFHTYCIFFVLEPPILILFNLTFVKKSIDNFNLNKFIFELRHNNPL